MYYRPETGRKLLHGCFMLTRQVVAFFHVKWLLGRCVQIMMWYQCIFTWKTFLPNFIKIWRLMLRDSR